MSPVSRVRSLVVTVLVAGLLGGLLPAVALAASPDAVDDPVSILEDAGPTPIDVLGNDTDGDLDPLTVIDVTTPTEGTASNDTTGVTYTPPADFHGTDTFDYTIDDGDGGQDTATVTVTVGSVNDAPAGADHTIVTAEDTAHTFVASDFGFSDPDDSPADSLDGVVVATLPAAGALTDNGSPVGADDVVSVGDIAGGKLAFAPATNGTGSGYAAFTFRVRDDGGTANGGHDTDPAANTITIDVTAGNDDPAAVDDSLTVARNAGPTAVDVLDNDGDPDGDTLTITAKTDGARGTVAITGGGTGLTYDPAPGPAGTDTFTYTIGDGNGGVDTGTVHVTISNTAPDADDDSATVDEDAAATAIPVLANDTDGNGDTLTITARTDGAKGTVTITGGGTGLTYKPDANATGGDTFTYTISDGNAGTDTASVSVTIDPAEDAPVAVDDTATVGATAGATAIDVLANDADPDSGDTLTITGTTDGAKGTVVLTGGGTSLTYEPTPGQLGPDTFTYTISDGHGQSDTATVHVTIADGEPPVAGTDAGSLPEDAAATAIAVLLNDSDPDLDPLTITARTNGAKGVVVITGGGSGLTYKPNANANGADSFTYTISDGHGWTAIGTVNVTITPVQDPPNAVNDATLSVRESAGATALAVKANDTDVDGDTLTITARTNGSHGTVAITGGGTGLTYDPVQLYYGTDVFTYTISDGHGGTDSATVLLTIVKDTTKPVAAAPVESFYAQTVGTSSMKAHIAWSGTDTNGTGIAKYQVQVSTNGGSYVTVSTASATSTSVNRTLTDGRSYRFRVRATDKQGNVGSYVYGPTFKPARAQNTSTGVHYTGTWVTTANRSASGGSHRYATSTGARASFSTTTRDIAWVATRTTTSGSAQVWIDGALAATINLRSSRTLYRQLVFSRHFTTLGSHTIQIRPAGGGRVYLDAFVVYH